MATLFTNGTETIKLYESINRGKPLYQLAYYTGGRRIQRNFADKAKAKRTAKRVLGNLAEDSEAVDNLNTPELESFVAAKKVLASGYHKLTAEEHERNGRRGRKRRLIERVFAHFKKWQHYRRVRYLGLVKNQLELTLKAVTYNLRRLVTLAAA